MTGHRVDYRRCNGCGLCYGALPALFRRNGTVAEPIDGPLQELIGRLIAVMEDCPQNAITLTNVRT